MTVHVFFITIENSVYVRYMYEKLTTIIQLFFFFWFFVVLHAHVWLLLLIFKNANAFFIFHLTDVHKHHLYNVYIYRAYTKKKNSIVKSKMNTQITLFFFLFIYTHIYSFRRILILYIYTTTLYANNNNNKNNNKFNQSQWYLFVYMCVCTQNILVHKVLVIKIK